MIVERRRGDVNEDFARRIDGRKVPVIAGDISTAAGDSCGSGLYTLGAEMKILEMLDLRLPQPVRLPGLINCQKEPPFASVRTYEGGA
jgi:hypothetical protein